MEDQKKQFKKDILGFYKKQGRHTLPWRKTTDPYKILVSEVMLQQTQVLRVIPKYEAFLKRFPTVAALAKASLSEVLRLWSGLGYNRRAKFLHESARYCVKQYKGVFPTEVSLLETFPGVGHYTARAVATFSFNQPSVFIETNIRTVFIDAFFKRKKVVSDAMLLPLIEETMDRKNPRQWYAALMDYGAFLKSQGVQTHRKSRSYKKQPSFKGSRRAIRGAIIKELIVKKRTRAALEKLCGEGVASVIDDLLKETLIEKKGQYLSLRS